MAVTRAAIFRDVPDAQWNDWRWQQAHRIRSVEVLSQVLDLTADEREACEKAASKFAMAITPYYASLMDPLDASCPVRRQAVPLMAELEVGASELSDPLAEDAYMPVPNLTHRYPDRALLYATHNCPVYCRHCNRKRKVGDPTSAPKRDELSAAIDYVRRTPAIRDVLVSGGDPLTLADARLMSILADLRSIPHLEIIRIATRNPVTLPMRITPDLVAQLRAFHPLFVNTHFNHERECTEEAGRALTTLADAGCVVGNQMVLLRGINDDPAMVKRMNQWLLRHRCRPYYIFQCDSVEGASHFRTPVESGVAIIKALRGWTSGLAVPHYVVDLPHGGGKVPVQPIYLESHEGTRMRFVNYAGEGYTYEEGT